jgi:hypothetical protein
MNLAELRKKTYELLGDGSEGSSTYSNESINVAVNKACEAAANAIGLTYAEAIASVQPATGTPGSSYRIPPSVTIPEDMVSLVRAQVYDGSMTDPIG